LVLVFFLLAVEIAAFVAPDLEAAVGAAVFPVVLLGAVFEVAVAVFVVVLGAVVLDVVVLGADFLTAGLVVSVDSVAAKAAQPTGSAITKIAARVRKDPV